MVSSWQNRDGCRESNIRILPRWCDCSQMMSLCLEKKPPSRFGASLACHRHSQGKIYKSAAQNRKYPKIPTSPTVRFRNGTVGGNILNLRSMINWNFTGVRGLAWHTEDWRLDSQVKWLLKYFHARQNMVYQHPQQPRSRLKSLTLFREPSAGSEFRFIEKSECL